MSTNINIQIPDSLARIYETASDADKQKAQWLVELVLQDLLLSRTESLSDVVQEISQRAAERGMTPEVLDDLLRDDD
jgi:hypothetical protein